MKLNYFSEQFEARLNENLDAKLDRMLALISSIMPNPSFPAPHSVTVDSSLGSGTTDPSVVEDPQHGNGLGANRPDQWQSGTKPTIPHVAPSGVIPPSGDNVSDRL